MIPHHKPASYFDRCNEHLLRAVPPQARTILEVGCGQGKLGALLKQQRRDRRVYGVEREEAEAREASQHLDHVFALDLEADDPPLNPGELDCILYGDVLEHLIDPEAVLRRHRQLLAPGGIVLCSIPNIQHFSIVTELLRGDFQYAASGLLDATHLRFFTYSTAIKMLLDTGYAPEIFDAISLPCPAPLAGALQPVLKLLGLHTARTNQYLNAYQYILRGQPVSYLGRVAANEQIPPLTFAVCVANESVLRANLLSSPCLAPGSPHEVLLFRGCRSAAEGLNRALTTARNPWVICVHQDMYLPEGWPERFWQQLREAESMHGNIGVAGVYGVRRQDSAVQRAGFIVDRDRLLRELTPLPAKVDTLDEVVLAIRKDTGLRFDERLGFHFYGADICLASSQRGLHAVCLDTLCFHNSTSVGLPPDFQSFGRLFARKWQRQLPLATSCAWVDQSWLGLEPVASIA